MGILSCIKWNHYYKIGIAVVRNHDVLVSTMGTDGEATRVFTIRLTDGHDMEKELIGLDLGQQLLR